MCACAFQWGMEIYSTRVYAYKFKQMSDAIMHMRNLIPYIRRKAAIKILEN